MHVQLHRFHAFALLMLALLPGFAASAGAASAALPSAEQELRALEIVAPTRSCADLKNVDLTTIAGKGSRIVSTEQTRREGVDVCSVEGILAPSIGFKVQLPEKTWGQRLLQVGCGGLCGSLQDHVGAADRCVPLSAGGFVIATTDMGHQGMGGEFGRDVQKREDFAHRAVHLTAVTSKRLIEAFYGRRAAYAYFTGCSDGGREAVVEAQRYPDDFNGIIAGAPAMNFQVQNGFYHAWQALANTGPDSKPILVAARLPLLHEAVLKQCDGLDGQVDGLITDPRACHFDPAVLQCPSEAKSSADCLTRAEVGAIRKFYDGPRDPQTGERLIVGGPQPGSELAWAGVFVPFAADQPIFSEMVALDALRNLIFATNPPDNFKLADLKFDTATFALLRAHHPLFDGTNPDLSGFHDAGGKLILWHGWADPHISPLNTIAYHEAVKRRMGAEQATLFERLYLLPGVYHCSGGEGPSLVDFLTPMMAWVEQGRAPEAVLTRQASPRQGPDSFGQPTGMKPGADKAVSARPQAPVAAKSPSASLRSRPLYPYPDVARYSSSGDIGDATSYRRAQPLTDSSLPTWVGEDFYTAESFLAH